jgi:glucose-1-phosphate cytidylyltransferase
MKTYAHYGFNEFILCLGYKGEVIKDYFRNFHWNTSDVTLKLGSNPQIQYHNRHEEEDWTVTMIDTGLHTQTGGRLKRALKYIPDDTFFLTYGDGLSNHNIFESLKFHQTHKPVVTLTAVQPIGRFGDIAMDDCTVTSFREKPEKQIGFISGGFFVMDKRIDKYLTGDDCVLEREPLSQLASEKKVKGFIHTGFWQCMDTYREQQLLTNMWNSGNALWKVW